MIDLYTWFCPNGHKIHIMLEEAGLSHQVKPVSIVAGEQFASSYRALNPNAKVPTIVDSDGPGGGPVTIFETGAILIYLAEKSGELLPTAPRERLEVMQWLMWQMGGLGPMLGQAEHFFHHAAQKVPYALDRYVAEANRLLGVLDARLEGRDFICHEYSIADIACFPWVRINKLCGQDIADFPNVGRWYGTIRNRPAVDRGLSILKERYVEIATSESARENLFGKAGV
jgi:GST-like protein